MTINTNRPSNSANEGDGIRVNNKFNGLHASKLHIFRYHGVPTALSQIQQKPNDGFSTFKDL